jgi:SAM-dependent methyltransferase
MGAFFARKFGKFGKFGKAGRLPRDPAPAASDDLATYLQGLSTRLLSDAIKGRVPYDAPPPGLETRLNGDPNPSTARYYADVLTQPALPPPTPTARTLDMGCGYGRIALELAMRFSPDQQYFGLDPHSEAIEWATANITPHHPNFTFTKVDISSKVYNSDGTLDGPSYRFPFEDESLDLVCMISVMTHVDIDTVETYIREAARTLKPTGRLVATFFLLDKGVDGLLAAGRSTFRMRWPHGPSRVEDQRNPELAIAHPRKLLLDILSDAGFAEPAIVDGDWCGRSGTGSLDYQDLVIANRQGDTTTPTPISEPEPRELDAVESDALAHAALQFTRLGLITPQLAADFLAWAHPVVINALWWHTRGLTLASVSAAGSEPFTFAFTHCRALGFDLHAPTATASGAAFTPVTPQDLLNFLVDAEASATQQQILDCVLEAAHYGMLIHNAMRTGRELTLHSPGSPSQPVRIPAVPRQLQQL